MKGIMTVKILLSITTVLGILSPMLPAGFCFLEQINPDKRDKARVGVFLMIMQRAAVPKMSSLPRMTEHNKRKDKAKNDSLGNIINKALLSFCFHCVSDSGNVCAIREKYIKREKQLF